MLVSFSLDTMFTLSDTNNWKHTNSEKMCTFFFIRITNLVNLDERLCFLFENAIVVIDILNFCN